MAERTGGGNTFLAFVVGALLVAVLGIGWMVWSGGRMLAREPAVNLDVKLPPPPSLPSPSTPNPAPTPTPAPIPKPG